MASIQTAARFAAFSLLFAGALAGTYVPGNPLLNTKDPAAAALDSWTEYFTTEPFYGKFNQDSNNIFYIHEHRAITFNWETISSFCMCRMRASKNGISTTPGTYGAYEPGMLYSAANMADSELEGYGHKWVQCAESSHTGTTAYNSASYSGLADGYYLFTFSCELNGAWQAEDFAFKIDNVRPVTTITPSADYDPSPKSTTTYAFTLTTTDYHGNLGAITTTHLPNPAYSAVTTVTDTTEKASYSYIFKLDNGAYETMPAKGTGTVLTLNGVTPGTHCVSVKALDASGLPEEYDAMYCWTTETFEKTTGCTFSYSLNNAEYVSTAGLGYASLTGLPDGTNTFTVKAFDMYNNPTTTAKLNTFSWTVDTALPTASFKASGTWSETEVVTSTKGTFKYSSSEAGSFFKYQVDGGAFVSAGMTDTQAFVANSFGVTSCSGTAHSFGVKAIDPVGNVGAVATSSFTVEPINTALALWGAATSTVVASSTAVFRITATVDNSAPNVFGYEYKMDSGAWIKGVHFPEFAVKGLADGTYTITARAITAGGCYDPSPISLTFTVDTTKPVTTLTQPATPANSASMTIYGSVTDATVAPLGTQYKLCAGSTCGTYSTPGNPVVPCASCPAGNFAIPLSDLAEGSYTLYAQHTDQAGLLSAETSVSWVVDFGAPETMILSGPPTPAHADLDITFRFSCQETGCTYMYDIDGTGYVALAASSLTTTSTPGIHTIQVYAIDAAGNADPTPAAYTWSTFAADKYGEYCTDCSFSNTGIDPLDFSPPLSSTIHQLPAV